MLLLPMENTNNIMELDFGGSIPVDNVQALAVKNMSDIPHRYIRPKISVDPISTDEERRGIPVIDLAKLIDRRSSHDEMAKLHWACEEWGFFQLINHGVCDELIEKMKGDVEEFFKLPLEEKMVCAQLPNYIEGYGQSFVVSDEQKLDWGDMLLLIPRPVYHRNMRFWPTHPTTFRETLDKYSLELEKVVICLMGFMAKNLEVDQNKFVEMFKEEMQGIRMNYYPPCPQAEKVLGISPHSDATGLTLLLQVNEVQGLQIKKDGKWIPVIPISGAFVVNIGDVIEIISNGKYKSIEHRAVINAEKERLSIAAFHGPNLETMFGPLPELVARTRAYYKCVSHEEFMTLVLSCKLDGKSALDFMKLKI